MEIERKTRSVIRNAFTRQLKAFQHLASSSDAAVDQLQIKFKLLSESSVRLYELDRKIFDMMLEADAEDAVINTELIKVDEYKADFSQAEIELNNHVKLTLEGSISDVKSMNASRRDHHVKFPIIELYKFNGDLINWLKFWPQFKKIHDDELLSNEDKFHYLSQSMAPNSRACDLINSFPPTGENYEKAIETLKNRFGKTELLVEVYVRELLQLVISKMIKKDEHFQVSSLYDKLESHLRALESLNITKEACAPLLFPLVESSLPEELLRAWQRYGSIVGNEPRDRLTKLLEFLQREVDNEERISMAMRSLDLKDNVMKNMEKKASAKADTFATASGLIAGKTREPLLCIFCGETHESPDCQKARKLALEERIKIVQEKNACFRCLKLGHGYRFCRSNKTCSWCGKKHVLLVCRESPWVSSTTTTSQDENKEVIKSVSNISVHQDVFLQTIKVVLRNEGKTKIVRAILDSGSQHSYILRNIAQEMQYDSQSKHLIQHGLFGGTTSLPEYHNKFRITIESLLSSDIFEIDVFDKNAICADIPSISDKVWLNKLKEKNIILTDIGRHNEPITLLIGADMMTRILSGKSIQVDDRVLAIETKLGWTLMGKNTECTVNGSTTLLVISLYVNQSNVSDLWRLDSLGIIDPIERKTKEMHLEQVKKNFEDSTVVNNEGKYEVLLPWKGNHPQLLGNRNLAYNRLQKVTKKLREENLFETYNQVFKDWEAEGIIEKIMEYDSNVNNFYYLPHRHVVRLSSSTTPIRPVYDASAHAKSSPSLNQCLETGPNLIELIPNLILRFREKRIGVISDIRKAFLQISICPKDRDVLRFLWWDEKDPSNLKIYRHCRVVFGLTSSPFLLGATIEHHLSRALSCTDSNERREIIGKLLNSFYVDNSITSVDNEQNLEVFQKTAIEVMKSGGFDLRCWEHSGEISSISTTSVLGLKWDKLQDTLSLNEISIETVPIKVTKRFILSTSHKIFDSLGIVCPVMLFPKLLLRTLWTTDTDWDTEINENDRESFLYWYSQLHLLKEIKIPRWFFGIGYEHVSPSFHVFVDASQSAYAAVVFMRIENAAGAEVRFVQAKARVAPTKETTIPRLELLGAAIGARLLNSIVKALDYEGKCEIYYWSDSTTVVSWIKRNCQWGVFVWNRVQEIRNLSKPEQWHFIPGEHNPADLPSRGCSVEYLIQSRWWEGPEWLKLPAYNWPKAVFVVNESEIKNEMKKSVGLDVVLSVQAKKSEDFNWYSHYFSDYKKLVRMISWIKRFVTNCRKERSVRIKDVDISLLEYAEAEFVLLKLVQNDTFSGTDDPKLSAFNTFKDTDGLIRVTTQVANKLDTYTFCYPIVLDPEHTVVIRLIKHQHKLNHHAGVQTLLNMLREKYWILRGRRAMRSVIKKCVICARYSTKKLQEMAPALPDTRVNTVGVFEIIGVDYAGPLYLKNNKKVWICLFTCAVYRAVHLELVSALTTEAFLQRFRRFIARRPRVRIIYSDNATCFTSASKCLQVEWIFNALSAPWWGGFFERLIGVVKDLLRKVLRTSRLGYEEMSTVLCECEHIVNSRPITYLSDDPTEPDALTPNTFLHFYGSGLQNLDNVEDIVLGYHRLQQLKRSLMKRFRDDYLGALCNRASIKHADSRPIKVGQVVLVGNDKDKRLHWPIARVVDLIPGRDGKVRTVRVRTEKGVLARPIQRVYPLELLNLNVTLKN